MRAEIENKVKVIDDETLFDLLGIPVTADENAVKMAFLQGAKRYHPDRIVAMGLHAFKEHADRIFRRINEAHQVLSDPDRRAEYVAELKLKSDSGDRESKEKELAVKAVNAELAFSRGTVFLRKRDYASAAREFEESVRLNAGEGEQVGYAAWARFCAGQMPLAEAIKDLLKAIKMDDKSGRLFYFLGVLYKQDDNEDKALLLFHKAKELDQRLEEADSEIRIIMARRAKKGKSGDSKGKPADSKGKSSDSKGKPTDAKGKPEPEKKKSFLDRLRQPLNKK